MRQESLEAVGRVHTITQYGLATVGVMLGIALLSAERSTIVAAILLMGLVPLLPVFGAVMAYIEVQRVVRARAHLYELERRINADVQDQSNPLRWETARKENIHPRTSGYGLAIVVVVTTTAIMGPGLGGYLLAEDDAWLVFVVAELADIALLTGFALWSGKTFQSLRSPAGPREALHLDRHDSCAPPG